MTPLTVVLQELDARAGTHGRAQRALAGGLVIVIDRRSDPHAVRFGRHVPAWPSGDEISTCRRAGLELPNGASAERLTRDGWNVVQYTYPACAAAAVAQPPLPELAPIVRVDHRPDESQDSQFARWLEANPHVLQAFCHYAFEARRAGMEHIGGKHIIERLRWESAIRSNGDAYKINNNWTSRLVRSAIDRHPELAAMFETRELRS